jgi:dolichyl-phosphate-mannose--protein O-mannosyl transferase
MRKFLFFIIAVFTFLIVAQNCLAVDLLLDWPKLGNQQSLNELNNKGDLGVPDLINYIYKFALGICGVTALVSIVYGGAQYAFSAGNSSKAEDAKDRITQALLGIVILLFAVLILRTINPDLINLTL